MAQPLSRGLAALVLIVTSIAIADPPDRHVVTMHHHRAKHPAGPDQSRFITSRDVPPLPLPAEDDAFFFVVYGDRTEGTPEDVNILAQAVDDTNLLQPDFVLTVGDLIQGYNDQEPWIAQMREYKGIMDGLICPWFPVAGNHDIYWRGQGRPESEHETNYETHFGPLWYAFEHKNCWFIILYSDEGDPATGERRFDRPASQRMSEEQFDWLKETLVKTSDAQHVFVALHHPRWLGGGYGDDWDRVHQELVAAGNVRAVFAGHIHRMRYDGPKDGIEYITLATTGGSQSGAVPQAGYLHHYHVVTVRPRQIALAALPVGEVMDVRAITGKVSDETRQLAAMRAVVTKPIELRADGGVDGELKIAIGNPTSRPIEVTFTPDSEDNRWAFAPDHLHETIGVGKTLEFTFGVRRSPAPVDNAMRLVAMNQQIDYLAKGYRYSVPESQTTVPVIADLAAPPVPTEERAVRVTGDDGFLEIPDTALDLPDGPFTIECWARGHSFPDRAGVVAKTENSDYGIFASQGVPAFYVYIEDAYVEVRPDAPMLEPDRWYHLAGVYDGTEARLYVDGQLVNAVERAGRRRLNRLPLLVGADVSSIGEATAVFDGWIDAVRLSAGPRYTGESFDPERRPEADDDTRLLLNMDGTIGPWLYDASGNQAHAVIRGNATLEDVEAEDVEAESDN